MIGARSGIHSAMRSQGELITDSFVVYPSAAANAPDNGSWANPTNAYSDNGVFASSGAGSLAMYWGGYNNSSLISSLPDNATINSLNLRVRMKHKSNTSPSTYSAHDLNSGTDPVATRLGAARSTGTMSGTLTDYSGPISVNPTVALLKSGGFWTYVSTPVSLHDLDSISITINYSAIV